MPPGKPHASQPADDELVVDKAMKRAAEQNLNILGAVEAKISSPSPASYKMLYLHGIALASYMDYCPNTYLHKS